MRRCLSCYKPLEAEPNDWHKACFKRFFGTQSAPALDLDLQQLTEAGLRLVVARTAVAGVQLKLSVDIEQVKDHHDQPPRVSIGIGDRYLLKPPTERYPELPELEDATMHLAKVVRIETAKHSLIRFRGGELGYITRRFDRTSQGQKLPMEDFCQITERLTENKYDGSVEQIGKAIRKYVPHPPTAEDSCIRLLEIVFFSFLVGNADMHLKNYALLTVPSKPHKSNAYRPLTGPRLSPAYDLVPTQLYGDPEESALTINGKKSKLKRADFDQLSVTMGIAPAVVKAIVTHFTKKLARVEDFLATTFISPELQVKYAELVRERLKRLNES